MEGKVVLVDERARSSCVRVEAMRANWVMYCIVFFDWKLDRRCTDLSVRVTYCFVVARGDFGRGRFCSKGEGSKVIGSSE